MAESMSRERARAVRLVLFDIDGVLTDGGVYIGRLPDGAQIEFKRFDVTDGLGIKLLRWAGLQVAFVSGRESPASAARAEELGVECHQIKDGFKLPVVEELLARYGVSWEETAFVSDDIADLPLLWRVGLPVAVANASAEVRAAAAWHTTRRGGEGAVREFVEALLKARGEWDGELEKYTLARGGRRVAHDG